MIEYARNFECNMTKSFKVNYDKLLKKYNETWKEVKSLLKIKFDSEPVHGDNDKYIKTKMKIYGGNVNTIFQGKRMSKEKASYKYFYH